MTVEIKNRIDQYRNKRGNIRIARDDNRCEPQKNGRPHRVYGRE